MWARRAISVTITHHVLFGHFVSSPATIHVQTMPVAFFDEEQ
jgi:hypothetical protein